MTPRSSNRTPALTATLVVAFLLTASANAQSPSQIGTHVVRPGDTLEDITAFYLGTPEAWRENYRLNPDVANPNLLFPGQRIKVILSRGLPVGSAQLAEVSGGVEEQPTPVKWQRAEQTDLLRQKDLLRSQANQSARLIFGDGTAITLGERSLLVLREDRQADVRARDKRELEVVRGQADLQTPAASPTRRPIEVVIGEATAKPKLAEPQPVRARARKTDTGAAQVMSFEGESVVEAAGTAVELAAGTGTSVAPGTPPSPPESLLAAPTLSQPEAGVSLEFANPAFWWEPTEGAAAYVVEICGDPECGRMVRRIEGLQDTTIASSEPLPVGTLYWRVTPVAASGLDGYPTEARPFNINSSRMASGVATARVVAEGPQAGLGEILVLGPGATLAVELEGETSGARFEPAVDGREASLEDWSSGWEPGAHRIEGTAVTAWGAATPMAPLSIVFDPSAPEMSWQVGEMEVLEEFGLDQGVEPKKPRRVERHEDVPVYWSADGRRWLPLLPPDRNEFRWVVGSDEPQVFFWADRDRALRIGDGTPVKKGQVVRVWVHDELSAASDLVLAVTPRSVELVATDLVGNESRRTFAIGR